MSRWLSSIVLLGFALAQAVSRQAQACAGDCSGDGQVSVSELVTCVGIVLSGAPTTGCPACDGDGDGGVAISDLIAGVNSALAGCPRLALPDLAPVSARFRSTSPACIDDTSDIRLSLEVCVANQGTAASGPFDVFVLGEPFGRVSGGLDAGAQTCLQGPFVPCSIDVLADAAGEVGESDETTISPRSSFRSRRRPRSASRRRPRPRPTPRPPPRPAAPPCERDSDCPSGQVCAGIDCVTPTATIAVPVS